MQKHYEQMTREHDDILKGLTAEVESATADKKEKKELQERVLAELAEAQKATAAEEAREKRLREVLHSEDVLQELRYVDVLFCHTRNIFLPVF